MTTNDSQHPVPTPADLDPNRAAREAKRARAMARLNEEFGELKAEADASTAEPHRGEQPVTPTPADVADVLAQSPVHRIPVVELTKEQRLRVEALHAARRVLGNPHTRGGQIAGTWAQQTIELADYIVTGHIFRELTQDQPKTETSHPAPEAPADGVRIIKIDPNQPLPADAPPALHALVREMKQAAALAADPEARAKRIRSYVDSVRSGPDGLKELNSRGYFPVDGSEPPRDEPLHDAYCHRWTFNQDTGRWTREVRPSDITGKPSVLSAVWGRALAEHGPFHFCG